MSETVLNRASLRASIRANPVVIDILHQVLDAARHGKIMAAAIVLVRPDATIHSCVSAPRGGGHHIVAACKYLKQDIIAETDN
jgi:hypothetical protein